MHRRRGVCHRVIGRGTNRLNIVGNWFAAAKTDMAWRRNTFELHPPPMPSGASAARRRHTEVLLSPKGQRRRLDLVGVQESSQLYFGAPVSKPRARCAQGLTNREFAHLRRSPSAARSRTLPPESNLDPQNRYKVRRGTFRGSAKEYGLVFSVSPLSFAERRGRPIAR
jgi:hypothetical protein